jgi:hypothetical protein
MGFTGMEYYRNVQLSPELEEAAAQVQKEVTTAIEAEKHKLEQVRMEGEQEEMAARVGTARTTKSASRKKQTQRQSFGSAVVFALLI